MSRGPAAALSPFTRGRNSLPGPGLWALYLGRSRSPGECDLLRCMRCRKHLHVQQDKRARRLRGPRHSSSQPAPPSVQCPPPGGWAARRWSGYTQGSQGPQITSPRPRSALHSKNRPRGIEHPLRGTNSGPLGPAALPPRWLWLRGASPRVLQRETHTRGDIPPQPRPRPRPSVAVSRPLGVPGSASREGPGRSPPNQTGAPGRP